MSENYQFVSTDTDALMASFVSAYERLTGRTLNPADPDRLFIAWAAAMFVQEREKINYVGNQNIPSRASGVNLDALGETIFGLARGGITPAKTTIRFNISEPQSSSQLIPAGTRVSDSGGNIVFATDVDAYIAIGETYVDVPATCITTRNVNGEDVNIGADGNGYVAGQINTLIDLFDYYSSCANITETDGGADIPTDEEYYEILRAHMDAWSTAGSMGSYVYRAKSVSSEIADVKAIRPKIKVSKVLPVYTLSGSSDGYAFASGDDLDVSSLVVYAHGSTTPAVLGMDYTVEYIDNLLKITLLSSGSLSGEAQIDIDIDDLKGGYVYIYILMDDGNIASPTIKALALEACKADDARPLTDYVSCEDPGIVPYGIDVTYYIQSDSELSASEIEESVNAAIEEYRTWQSEKLGRDINPSYLQYLLMQTGIKRVEINAPGFIPLKDGSDNTPPQVASLKDTNIFTGDGETRTFDLSFPADAVESVMIDGTETIDFTCSAGSITFDVAPPNGSDIVVEFLRIRVVNGGYEDE